MLPPKREFRRQPEARTEPAIDFIGPQEGPIETRLTSELAQLFAMTHPEVGRAYLVRVCYRSTGTISVALCIRSTMPKGEQLVTNVGHRFAELFNRETHLDIIFLSLEQEEDLKTVCRPFYEAT